MSSLDFRTVKKVEVSGIAITTFLSDDRSRIMVSVSDLSDNLALDVPELGQLDNVYSYRTYDNLDRGEEHYCIEHKYINDLLWSVDCNPDYRNDLSDFRRYFYHEVVKFWDQYHASAESLSIRDASSLIDLKTKEYCNMMGISVGRIYQFGCESMLYDKIPLRTSLPTEQLVYLSTVETLYTSLVAQRTSLGMTLSDAMGEVENLLQNPLRSLGPHVRNL